MKNPNFNREELILCLDLYFKLDYGQMHGRNPEIIKLSEDLRNLSLHKKIPNEIKFRSVNSVALKLANFKRLDSNFEGRGMKMGAKMDRVIWKEFHGHRDTLKKEAFIIRQLNLKNQSKNKNTASDPIVSSKSEFYFQYHKNRETDPLVLKVKKEIVFDETKKLKCEVCGFDSLAFYGEIGNDLMEIHYVKVIKNEPGLESSDMKDFIIICSNCHKALDKNYGLLDAGDLKKIIKKK
ncbi:MAG: hypothetical protein PHT69_08535 [Bacteroidales bacterium]|nr:hypothetical protein [Bacteroidales bacterium]